MLHPIGEPLVPREHSSTRVEASSSYFRTRYRTAAELLDVPPGRMLMVAAHKWDIDGARDAGMRTAFLERPAEKGPHRRADRAADTTCDIDVRSVTGLATVLGC